VAARVRLQTDTVDIAGIAFRVSCRFPKPGFWARRHPEFLTRRRPDVVVHIVYDERFRGRAREALSDTVADAPRVLRRGQALLLTTGYYRATVDRRRVSVRMAAGFDVAGLMRTLAALWLLERQTLLVRAVRLGRDGATLACGVPDAALAGARGVAVAGWIAVTPGPDGVTTRLTPFLEHDGRVPARGPARASHLWVPGAAAAPGTAATPRSVGPARALTVLLPAVWQADRRRPALERTLDLAMRISRALQCHEVGEGAPRREELAVG
jgi:hypothetical protein